MVDVKTAIDELNTGKIKFSYNSDNCCTTEGEVVILLKRLERIESELAEDELANEDEPNEWKAYLNYLVKWAFDHQDEGCEGMSPACFDEWLDNEGSMYEEKSTENNAKSTMFFDSLCKGLPDYSEGRIWTTYDEILVKDAETAETLADIIESYARANDETIVVNTGYYDPIEDERNGEVDRHTGWYYVNIG